MSWYTTCPANIVSNTGVEWMSVTGISNRLRSRTTRSALLPTSALRVDGKNRTIFQCQIGWLVCHRWFSVSVFWKFWTQLDLGCFVALSLPWQARILW